MKKSKDSTITMDQLLASGWKKGKDSIIFAKKTIGKDKELGTLDLILHNWSNTPTFALSLPDGAMVNINPASIEDLNAFEKMILSYEPNF